MMEKPIKKKLTFQEAIPKIEYFCNYQERCQMEVRDKLYSFGLNSNEVEQALSEMVKRKLLNEERFSIAYAGGKFRQKKWGRNKIIRELKARQISPYCISKAMQEIDNSDYRKTILSTAEKYAATIKTGTIFTKKQKTLKYLISKGFEYDECHEIMERLFSKTQ